MGKRIAAISGILLLVLMYVATLLFAVLARPEANRMFLACIVMTVLVPLLLWIAVRMYERAHDRKNGMSIQELRKLNKRLKAGENPEQLAKEIEETYQPKDGKK